MDLEGVVWLSKQLTEHIGDTMVLMVSHDAGFLDAVTTDIIHFQLKQLTYYVGNYSAFLKVMLIVCIGDDGVWISPCRNTIGQFSPIPRFIRYDMLLYPPSVSISFVPPFSPYSLPSLC